MMSNSNEQASASLTQDAWRRLQRSKPSMIALGVLALVTLLALFTPILPLQPPDQDDTSRLFAAPVVAPLFEATFDFDPSQIIELSAKLPGAQTKLTAARRSYQETLATDQATANVEDETPESLAAEKRIEDSQREVARARAAVDLLIQRPYSDAGFPKLGAVSRQMVRIRYALCGKWSLASVCGRDKLGRDLLSRIFWGARISLIVGIVATLVSLVIGVTYGAVSGYAGGWVDNLMMRAVDVLYSVPFIFLVIFIITILKEYEEALAAYGIDRITIFYLVVGALYWLTMARVVRGQVISLRNEQFVEAARSLGVSQTAIIFRHIVPNLFSVVIVYLTLTIPRVVLFEAFLSFLGMGVEPPDVSWGLLANEGIKVITPVRVYWWLILFPSIAIGITLFALNFLGDGLRDAFDPRMKDR